MARTKQQIASDKYIIRSNLRTIDSAIVALTEGQVAKALIVLREGKAAARNSMGA